MAANELVNYSISELAPIIKQKQVSPVEIVNAYLNRIDEIEPKVNAYITVLKDEALKNAYEAQEQIAKGYYKGALHGIPLTIKDNIDTKGIRTTYGAKIHTGHIPEKDAFIVTRLVKAGMIPLGKANLHEYAMGVTTTNPHHGATKNPWNLEKIPGGSSGGSAAALAAKTALAALGTDTAGSVRIPSACCGTVGLKPTFGRVSKDGVFPLSWTLDHVGPMTRTVKDAAILFEAMNGYDENDPNSIEKPFSANNFATNNLRGVVIGIPEEHIAQHTDQTVLQALEKMVEELKALGAEIRPVSIPAMEHVPYTAFITIWVEAATIHQQQLLERSEDFGADVVTQLKLGSVLSGVQYMQAQQLRRKIVQELEELFKDVDAIVMPTIPIPAPTINQTFVQVNGLEQELIPTLLHYTTLANVSGLPSLAVPSGLSPDGLPVGLQIIGKAFDERTILNIGYQLEQTNPLREKSPAIK